MTMRKDLVLVSLESPWQEPQKGRLHSLEVVSPMKSYGAVAILSWGAIGSLAVPTAHPGGVRFPGAPLSFKIAIIYP
jgi:hypothetical protein